VRIKLKDKTRAILRAWKKGIKQRNVFLILPFLITAIGIGVLIEINIHLRAFNLPIIPFELFLFILIGIYISTVFYGVYHSFHDIIHNRFYRYELKQMQQQKREDLK